MRTVILLILTIFLNGAEVVGQHPLTGTWEMISVKGIGADGEPFFYDTTSVRETKIITPIHYMLIAWDVDKDSLIFNRTMAGQVNIDGNKYIEIPTQASVQIFDNVKADFFWKLEGDLFTQSGTIVRPDGRKVILEELIFKRVTNVKSVSDNPAIGTWRQVSGNYDTAEGKKVSSFGESDEGLLLVTPTHWMRMDHRNQKFESALYGTYTMDGDTVENNIVYSSYPLKKSDRFISTRTINGNKIQVVSTRMMPEGKPGTFYDTFEKVKK